MRRTRTSRAWMQEHVNDAFVQRAKREGYRSRAAYKLMEIDDRDRLLHRGAGVIDLGAAPGGWSQVAAQRTGPNGKVIAVDLLDMAPVPGTLFVRGDFTDAEIKARILGELPAGQVDLVLSDVAPNMSGVPTVDQARAAELVEAAIEFAAGCLKPTGALLVKCFQGSDFEGLRSSLGAVFRTAATRKPAASRDRSNEIYLLGRHKR